jgi:hypothetical protein
MTNTAGFTTVTPLSLQRTCFTDEQDRLNEYAKSLRVPIQTGQLIKGDQGEKGDKGSKGDAGPRGEKGATPTLTTVEYNIANGATSVTIPSVDARNKIINLVYNDSVNDPVSPIGIFCIRVATGGNTIVYLTGATPNALYKLSVSSF